MTCQCSMRTFLRFGVANVISGIKRQIFFAFSVLLQMVTCSVGELNFSKDFMNERRRIAYVTESLLKILFVFIKILLY